MQLAEWKAGGRQYIFRGYRIFYRDDGRGDVLLCIHGFPTASWDWHKLWPELTRRFRVIAVDMLGFGYSDKPWPHDYSIIEQADVHERLLTELGIHACHILAHDYGDTVAQELLARFHGRRDAAMNGLRILSVCFLNGGLFPEATRPLPIQRLLVTPAGALVARLTSKRSFAASFRRVFSRNRRPDADTIDRYWQLLTADHGKRVIPGLSRYQRERRKRRIRWIGAIRHDSPPLQLVAGLADRVSGATICDAYENAVPAARVIRLADVGHYPQLESPAAIIDALIGFVEKVRGT